MTPLTAYITADRIARLDRFCLLSVAGSDRESFLQGQLTHDVPALPATQHQLAGYCSPKGRLLAVMRQWKDAEAVHHVLPTDIAEDTAKRLRMFVLRAKATIKLDAQANVWGLYGACAQSLPVSAAVYCDMGWLLRAPDCPVMGPRAWLIVPAALGADAAQTTPCTLFPQATTVHENAWIFSEIQCGLPWITQPTREAFVPQMVNLELVNGVSFTKGCYTGQEVVARSQYLGKLKRRMFHAELPHASASGLDASALAGRDIWPSPQAAASQTDTTEPAGRVVLASVSHNQAGQAQDKLSLLIESTLQAWSAGDLRLDSAQGPALIPAQLPYPVTDLG